MRKKIFAVIMSVMMMVTFMPAMAFATVDAGTGQWGANYDSFTYKEAGKAKKADSVAKALDDNGKITVYALDADNKVISSEAYYNLNYMTVSKLGTNDFADTDYSFEDAFDPTVLNLNAASQDATLKFDLTKEEFYVANSFGTYDFGDPIDFNGKSTWSTRSKVSVTGKAKVVSPEYDITDKFSAQEFDLEVVWIETGKTVGTLAKKHIKIAAKEKADVGDATFAIDGKTVDVKTKKSDTVVYTGEEHTFAMNELNGLSVTYEVKNNTTNVWETVENVTYKNAGKYEIRAHVKDSKNVTDDIEFTVTVNPVQLVFEFDSNDREYDYYNNTSGYYAPSRTFTVHNGFDPMTYVSAVKVETSTLAGFDTTANAKAAKKVVKNDAEMIMSYLKDFYEVEQTPSKYDENTINAELKAKDLSELTMAEKDALITKYADFFGNYSKETLNRAAIGTKYAIGLKTTNDRNEISFVIDQETLINWTKAPLTKTFKYKALKKSSKKFTVKAKSASSDKIVYSLKKGGSMIKINKTSGKITVKKGLKKGTYSVVVGARVGYDKNHNSGSDSYTLKIRVK